MADHRVCQAYTPAMRTTTYNKLVRDRIPEVITSNGGIPKVRRLPASKLAAALKDKLLEESAELWQAKTRDDVVAEMADIREILDALCVQSEIDPREVAKVQRAKRAKRGGFVEGLWLVSVRE